MVVFFGPVEHHGAAFEGVRVPGVRQVALAELFRDHARLHDCGIEQVARQHLESRLLFERLAVRTDHVAVLALGVRDIIAHSLGVDGERIGVKAAGAEQLVHHRRQPAGAVVFLAESRLAVH